MGKIIIALDGFSGTGKSSTAKEVARALDYLYIDSGAMYRAVTLYFLNEAVDWNEQASVSNALANITITFHGNEIFLNGENVSMEIRTMRINENVSAVSAIKSVRESMVAQQQRIGRDKGIVMDGRDIGTVVFPKAELKVFMTANPRVRAERRQKELAQKGIDEKLHVIQENLLERDQKDSSRTESPLIKADGAVEIDTSGLTFDDQVHKIVSLAKEIIYAN
ncbi:MAG: (d)CMP kinase [Marinoscillum sp.]